MKFTKHSLLLLMCVASATLTAEAAKITRWTGESVTGMNSDYVDLRGWTIPHYDNEILVSGTVDGSLFYTNGANGMLAAGTNVIPAVWYNTNTYVLLSAVVLGNPTNASLGKSTLYIQPGTVIRGMPWRSGNDTVPGGLYISAGSKLYCRGGPTNPVIFTDMWDNNVPGMTAGVVTNHANYQAGCTNPSYAGWAHGYIGNSPTYGMQPFNRDYSVWQPTFGYWGGVVLNGRTSVAATFGGAITPTLNSIYALTPDKWTQNDNSAGNYDYDEGVNFKIRYGGTDGVIDEDDSSGAFTYSQIRYNGYPLAVGGSEINGLSLYGVGRGTELHHVEIMNSGDDSIEWFGGSVNLKYAVTWAYGDDGWDTDQGFHGKNQFLFAMQGTLQDVVNQNPIGTYYPVIGSLHSDKGMEMDSSDNDPTKRGLPLALSAWWNGTWVGQGPTNDVNDPNIDWASEATGAHGWDTYPASKQPTADSCLLMRDGACPHVFNGIFTEFRGAGVVAEYCCVDQAYCNRGRNDSYGYWYDVWAHANRPWNQYPVVTNAPAQYFDNTYVYNRQEPGYMMDVEDNVFYKLGSGQIVPVTGRDIENAAGRETAGSKNQRHMSLRWMVGTTPHSLTKTGAAGDDGNIATMDGSNFEAFPGLLSHGFGAYPDPYNAVERIISNNELTVVNPLGAETRADVTDYRYAKGVRNVLYIDPYPQTANVLASRRTPPEDGFYTPVNFKGAFDPTQVNWMHGWTLCETLGLVEMHTNAALSADASTGAVQPVAVAATIGTYPAVRAMSPVAGARYLVETSNDLVTWTAAGYIDEDGTDKWFTDASGANHKYFRTSRIQ